MTSGAVSDPAVARGLGAVTLGLAASALLAQAWRAGQVGRAAAPAIARGAASTAALPRGALSGPARGLHAAAALLAASVLADSAVEHARANYANPGMFAPLLAAGAALLAAAAGTAQRGAPPAQRGVYGIALAVGAAGTAFHLYNLLARPGRLSWANLFYGAPLGAPAALSLAGVLGLAALRTAGGRHPPFQDGRALCAIVSAALAGTTGEVALLHFRGAYHNPFMWLPVTIAPVTAAMLAVHAAAPARASRRLARAWLAITGVLGLGGIGFHARGVARQMGGWRNWRQNVLSGPPLPAPPSLTALALGGMSALALLDRPGPAP